MPARSRRRCSPGSRNSSCIWAIAIWVASAKVDLVQTAVYHRLQRLAGAGELPRMGLQHRRCPRRARCENRQGNLELDGYICFGRRRSAERPARADVHARRRRGKMFAELRQKGRFGRRLRQIAQKSAPRFADRGLVYCWQIRQKGSFTEVFGIEKS